MKIEELLRENIRNLTPYASARDEYSVSGQIQLDANENPFENGLNRYPDPYQTEAKEVIAAIKGQSSQNLVLGNGSDELIDLVLRAFCRPGLDNAVGLKPSYGMYRVSCEVNDVAYKEVALNEDFSLNVNAVLQACDTNTKVMFICSPNNPTGNVFDKASLEVLIKNFNGIIVLDEAYIDFSTSKTLINDLDKIPQLIVIQTLSKAFGMASARLGMAWCSVEMVEIFNRIKPPYNVNGLTQKAILELKTTAETVRLQVERIRENRESLSTDLMKLGCVQKVYASQANFLLVKFRDADRIYRALAERGVVVRNRSNEYGCKDCLRISIGTEEENQSLMDVLKILEDEKSIVYR